MAANARQAAIEISKITWNGNTGRDAYVWLAELRLALESRVISPSNPHGLWPSMDAAFAFCRTSSWFPANSTYRSIFQQPSLSWSSFESSCKLNLFRQFDHKNFRSELKRFTWDLPTDPVVAWSNLELKNNYLPADYRLSFARLRRIWGGGCLSGQWQLVLEDLRFPQHGRKTTYESPRVSITEIIRALDARGVNFASSSSSSAAPAAAVSSLVSRVAALEKQATRRDRDCGTPRLNLVAFSRAGDVRDTYGRPLRPPPPSSHTDLKKAYVNQVLLAAQHYAATNPELDAEFTADDTYELYRLLDDPPSSNYEPGPLVVYVAETYGQSQPQYRPGFPGPRANRWPPSRNPSRERDRSNFRSNRPPSRPPSPGPHPSSSSHTQPSAPPPSSTPGSDTRHSGMSSSSTLPHPVQVNHSTLIQYPPLLLFSILRSFYSEATHFGPVSFNKASSPLDFSHVPLIEVLDFSQLLAGSLSVTARSALARTLCFAHGADLAQLLAAIQSHRYSCIVVTPPLPELPPSSLAPLQRLAAAPPTLVRSSPPSWTTLADPSAGSLAWLLDGSLESSPVDWSSTDPAHPPLSVIPCGILPLGPAYAGLLLFTTRDSSL
ncbi:hypothetical protein HDU96_003380, partial [Phlyctochytrium bullatum]